MVMVLAKSFKLQLTYETGLSAIGKPIFKKKTYSGVMESATADQLHQVGQALASLSSHQLATVEKNAVHELLG